MCVCVCVESYKEELKSAINEKSGGAERREGGMEGWRDGEEDCGCQCGFGFLSLKGEEKWIDSEAESEADQVAT